MRYTGYTALWNIYRAVPPQDKSLCPYISECCTPSPYMESIPLESLQQSREALIKSLFDYTLVFSCNTRNNPTRLASYLKQQSCIGLLQGKLIGQPLKGKRFNGQAKRQSAAGLQVLCRTCTLSLHIKAPSFYSWPSYDEAVHKNPYKI